MKKFLALFLALVALVGCNDEPSMDVVLGGEETCVFSVSIDGDTLSDGLQVEQTRTASDDLLALLGEEYEFRYILQVYHADGKSTQYFKYSKELTVNFNVTLPPTRNYNFVVWADIVEKSSATNPTPQSEYYTTEDGLDCITIKNWACNTDLRDAFVGSAQVINFSSSSVINCVTLTRPFAKLRIVATNADNPTNGAKKLRVSYPQYIPTGFDARTGRVDASVNSQYFYSDIDIEQSQNAEKEIFTDYIFASAEESSINVDVALYDDNNNILGVTKTITVPIARNKITTIKGDIL